MLISSIIIFMLYQSLNNRRDRSILMNRTSLNILYYCILISYLNFDFYFFYNSIGLFGSLFHSSSTTHVFHLFILILCFLILGLNSFYSRKIIISNYSYLYIMFFVKLFYKYRTGILNKMSEQFRIMEYSLIILFVITGSLFLTCCSDLISIFLSIELQSYGLYLVSTIYRNSEPATAAGLTYFLLGGLSSCFILLSTGLLYINSGTTNLDSLYVITTISDMNNSLSSATKAVYLNQSYYIHMSLIVMSVGFLFKVAAAPFHFWSPDVYDGIPTIVTTFVAIIAKIAIFIFLLELIHFTDKSLFSFNWTSVLLISSLLSLIIGTVLGLTQFRIKRLYAYSTISHVGFILLALSIQTMESIQAFIFYLIQYSITNLNAFILLLAIGFSVYCYTNDDKSYKDLQDKNNSPIQLISQLKGYFYLNPVLALSLAITLFSFIGVPPLVGFFGKQLVLKSALDNGYIFICLVAILTSVISAVYYLFIIKHMFFDNNENKPIRSLVKYEFTGVLAINNIIEKFQFKYNKIVLSSYISITISILTLSLVIFIFQNIYLLNLTSLLTLTIIYN